MITFLGKRTKKYASAIDKVLSIETRPLLPKRTSAIQVYDYLASKGLEWDSKQGEWVRKVKKQSIRVMGGPSEVNAIVYHISTIPYITIHNRRDYNDAQDSIRVYLTVSHA